MRSNPLRASRRSWWARNGSPAISISAFGMDSVTGRSRVASPPARMAIGSMVSGTGHHHGALEIETHANLTQAGFAQHVAEARLVLCIQHQESAAAGADQLSPKCAVGAGQLVVFIDARIGHGARPVLFQLPMLVHNGGE